MKRCSRCKQLRDFSHYSIDKRAKDGYACWCINCVNEQITSLRNRRVANKQCIRCEQPAVMNRQRCQKHLELKNKRNCRINQELRLKVYKVYGNRCNCCGEANEQFLTVDHINNDGGVQRKAHGGLNTPSIYRWMITHNYPKDLQLLCYNCNIGKHRNKGVCPHAVSILRNAGTTIVPFVETPGSVHPSALSRCPVEQINI